MPNFHTSTLILPKLPASLGDYNFLWQVKSKKTSLVFVEKDDKQFFITIHEKKNSYLVKGDKISRPSQVLVLQEALQNFATLSKCDLTFSNIQSAPNRYKDLPLLLKNINFFVNNNFSSKDKIYIEVGFGSGRHLLFQAKQNPDKLIIGIEIYKPSIEQVVKLCEAQEVDNILLVDYDARILMEYLPSNIVEKIFVHFPVPWDKKPHRRVISKYFVEEASRVLKVCGTLELRTDSKEYFDSALEHFLEPNFVEVNIFKNRDLSVISKYEDRWKKQNKDIYDLTLTSHEKSVAKKPLEKLKFDFKTNISKIVNSFVAKTHLGDGFFVHFETLYEKEHEEKIVVIKVSFGSTQRPEHSYILINESGASYFPNDIYNTNANFEAHKIITDWLINE